VDRAVCALSFIRVVRLLILISQSADPAGAEAAATQKIDDSFCVF
jgi:hypothetical protein